MKAGRSLQEIAAELQRQVQTRKDYIAPQGVIDAVIVDEGDRPNVALAGVNGAPIAINPYAHKQIADDLGIPQKYYERMRAEQPALLVNNINAWFKADPGAKRMIRTLDHRVRAVLSPKFRPLDNFDVANVVLPVLQQKGVQVLSAELTETRMYIKGIMPALSEAPPVGQQWGDGHHMVGRGYKDGRLVAAVTISNSDVGAGTLRIEPSVFTTWCTNLAVIAEAAMRKYHVGRSFSADENREVFRDETRRADDRAFFLKVRDVTLAAFNEDTFKMAIAQIRDAAGRPIVAVDNLPKVVEVATKRLGLPESTGASILGHLAKGGDMSQWGLSSAVTAAANTADDYEFATELEHAGGKVLALGPAEWQQIAEAA